jgi:hypothetical protein
MEVDHREESDKALGERAERPKLRGVRLGWGLLEGTGCEVVVQWWVCGVVKAPHVCLQSECRGRAGVTVSQHIGPRVWLVLLWKSSGWGLAGWLRGWLRTGGNIHIAA